MIQQFQRPHYGGRKKKDHVVLSTAAVRKILIPSYLPAYLPTWSETFYGLYERVEVWMLWFKEDKERQGKKLIHLSG
jgi:hypothetical protein